MKATRNENNFAPLAQFILLFIKKRFNPFIHIYFIFWAFRTGRKNNRVLVQIPKWKCPSRVVRPIRSVAGSRTDSDRTPCAVHGPCNKEMCLNKSHKEWMKIERFKGTRLISLWKKTSAFENFIRQGLLWTRAGRPHRFRCSSRVKIYTPVTLNVRIIAFSYQQICFRGNFATFSSLTLTDNDFYEIAFFS